MEGPAHQHRRQQASIIIIPERSGKVYRLFVSRHVPRILGLLFLSFSSLFFYLLVHRFRHPPQVAPTGEVGLIVTSLESELVEATRRVNQTLAAAQEATRQLTLRIKAHEERLAELRTRHDQLAALVSGQEELARTYGRILRERPWWQQAVDGASSLALGVLATLAGAWFLARFKQRRIQEVTDEQAKAIRDA